MAATSAVTRAQNRAVAKGTDPKAATCRAKLQRARSALNRQMDRELRLREGAENLLRATTKDGGGGDNGGVSGVGRHKNKNRKLVRQTVALELSFLESNVRLLADELAELNGSVDVYQHRDDDDHADEELNDCGGDVVSTATDGVTANRGQRRRRRQMPMIAVPLKDTRPIDFGPPLERFIGQHYGVDLSATPGQTTDGERAFNDDRDDGDGVSRRRRLLSLREAVDELTQLRLDTQTPSRDADGVRLLLRYYRQLYYVDRRFFPPSVMTANPMTTASRHYNHHNHQHQQQQHDHRNNRHNKQKQQQHTGVADTPAAGATASLSPSFSSTPPAIHFEWYDSFGGPVPSCGQRTVRFEQACVLFNVAAVHTQMGAKHDRRCFSGTRDPDEETGRPTGGPLYTSTGSETTDGATAAAQCFLRAAGAYRHIGDTFANAPARAADLRATGVLYAVMMAQAYECIFEKLQWRLLASVRHRCRLYRSGNDGTDKGGRRRQLSIDGTAGASPRSGDRRGRGAHDSATRYRRTSATTTSSGSGSGMNDVTTHTPSWTELAREAAHVSRMYAEVVYNSCRPDDCGSRGGKENSGEQAGGGTAAVLPDVWVSVCRIKDRHYAALAYRYAACALLPYYRCSADDRLHRRHRDRYADDETEADELLTELTTAAAAVGLELTDDDDVASATVRQQRRRKQLGTMLLEAAAAAHDRAARAQRLCRQLRAKTEGNATGGGGLLAGVLDREWQRTVRLLLLHRRKDNEYDDTNDGSGGKDDDDNHCCCRFLRCGADGSTVSTTNSCHDCFSDDDGVDDTVIADHCSGGGDQEEFTATGIAGIPGLDVDRGVLFRPRTRFRLMAIAPDFTDTGDDDNDIVDGGTTTDRQRQRREQPDGAADLEERRADLFAGLGPVAVFSARHRCTRPRWVKVVRGGRHHRSAGDIVAIVGGVDDEDESAVAALDPIQLVDRWFGFELRSHGGGVAAAVPPATVGHVRSNSQAQLAGLRRGDIVVALKRTGDNGSVALDVRWDTCRRVAELIVQQYQRRRQQSTIDGCSVAVQLKVVTPIAAMASDVQSAGSTTVMDPNKMYPRRRTQAVAMNSSLNMSGSPPLSSQLLPQPTLKQRRPNTNRSNEGTDSTNKINIWLWNPFRRRRRSVVGN